ncbi:MAG TPA: hypothetical protein VEV85_12510, partial [Bryobacteraceae bacterium]|nr:hypothetical protein [Bryobacteraceae bacterium]
RRPLSLLREEKVKKLEAEGKIRLVYPARRALSHATGAFWSWWEAKGPDLPGRKRGGPHPS